MTKAKICKGTGKAIGNGCGVPHIPHKFGLCPHCFVFWVFNTDSGRAFLESTKIRAKKQVAKESKKEQAQKKEENRKKTWYEKNLEKDVNEIVRLIDSDKGCISCLHGWESVFTRQAHAGHHISVGSNATLRFNAFNIYKQCSICNRHKHANDREYDKGIICHYGQEALDYIEQLPSQYKELHLSIDELKQAIINARAVKKEILSGIDYSRKEINKQLGIYK